MHSHFYSDSYCVGCLLCSVCGRNTPAIKEVGFRLPLNCLHVVRGAGCPDAAQGMVTFEPLATRSSLGSETQAGGAVGNSIILTAEKLAYSATSRTTSRIYPALCHVSRFRNGSNYRIVTSIVGARDTAFQSGTPLISVHSSASIRYMRVSSAKK